MEAVIVIIMVIVLVKLGKVLFGEDERYYDCAVCEKCSDGCYFKKMEE